MKIIGGEQHGQETYYWWTKRENLRYAAIY